MKKTLALIICVFTLLSALLCSGCGNTNKDLIGCWVEKTNDAQGNENWLGFKFNDDGTCEFAQFVGVYSTYQGNYSIKDNKLTININNSPLESEFQIENDILTMTSVRSSETNKLTKTDYFPKVPSQNES